MQPGGMAGGLVSGFGKSLSLLSIVLLLASLASAQNRKEPEYLLISVLTEAGGLSGIHEKVIVTKQDGSQEVIRDHSLRTMAFASKGINIVEDSLMMPFHFLSFGQIIEIGRLDPKKWNCWFL
jgi:hypothetical protein